MHHGATVAVTVCVGIPVEDGVTVRVAVTLTVDEIVALGVNTIVDVGAGALRDRICTLRVSR